MNATFAEVEFFTEVFQDITRQLLAICPSISSRKFTFCRAVRLLERGTDSPSSVRPRRAWVLVFFLHLVPSARNGAKLLSSDKV